MRASATLPKIDVDHGFDPSDEGDRRIPKAFVPSFCEPLCWKPRTWSCFRSLGVIDNELAARRAAEGPCGSRRAQQEALKVGRGPRGYARVQTVSYFSPTFRRASAAGVVAPRQTLLVPACKLRPELLGRRARTIPFCLVRPDNIHRRSLLRHKESGNALTCGGTSGVSRM